MNVIVLAGLGDEGHDQRTDSVEARFCGIVIGMILFKEPSVQLILRGEKTQARKLWARARAKEGAEHLLYRRPPMTGEKPFARILVTRVWKQRLRDMTEEEARAEGWPDKPSWLLQFSEGRRFSDPLDDVEVFALEFHLVETFEEPV